MNRITMEEWMSDCCLCPRQCHADRREGELGFCRSGADITAARASLHMWEEPCISGCCGSGTVFFSGCNLRCIFCQNHEIALGKKGHALSPKQLADTFLRLQEKGAHNINLVTPTHFVPLIREALLISKESGLTLPIVYNTGSYEYAETLHLLDGLIDIYLPDLKYYASDLSMRYSRAADYFPIACDAIAEMFAQTGSAVFDPQTGLMKKGMIVRHLVLPGQTKDSKKILRYLHETYGDRIYISIMNQFTPLPQAAHIPELNRRVTKEEYERVLTFASRIGITNGFIQDGDTAEESFIPPFDAEGFLLEK